jgi:hypothetical protein
MARQLVSLGARVHNYVATDSSTNRFPLYYEAKFLFIVWLVSPGTQVCRH